MLIGFSAEAGVFTGINNCPYNRTGKRYSKQSCSCDFTWSARGNSKSAAFKNLKQKCARHKGKLRGRIQYKSNRKGKLLTVTAKGVCQFKATSRVVSKGYARVINIRKHFPRTWWSSTRGCGVAKQSAIRACYKYIDQFQRAHRGGQVKKIGGTCKRIKGSKMSGYVYGPMCFYVKKEVRAYFCRAR